MSLTRCPACSSDTGEVFFSMRGLPVHGTAVYETAEDARRCSVGDQILAVCHSCGLVFNTVFDSALLDYGGAHAESQMHSPTFRAFAEQLAGEWVEQWNLENESVLEIGCGGPADFAHVLIRAGAGHVHGVDPGVSPDVTTGTSGITVERGIFSPSCRSRAAKAIVCRHTLEHVQNVSKFLTEIVEGVDPRCCRALLFEVPDFANILAHNAFWDLHYEHCSNFCETSLAALFERAGCKIESLRRVYRRQYLVIEARPATGGICGDTVSDRGAVDDLVQRCRSFAVASDAKLRELRSRFRDNAQAHREIVLWGGGAKATVLLNMIKDAGVTRVIDINPGLQGHFLGGAGVPILSPGSLKTSPPWAVVLMNPIYRSEVRQTLDQSGLERVQLLDV